MLNRNRVELGWTMQWYLRIETDKCNFIAIVDHCLRTRGLGEKHCGAAATVDRKMNITGRQLVLKQLTRIKNNLIKIITNNLLSPLTSHPTPESSSQPHTTRGQNTLRKQRKSIMVGFKYFSWGHWVRDQVKSVNVVVDTPHHHVAKISFRHKYYCYHGDMDINSRINQWHQNISLRLHNLHIPAQVDDNDTPPW